MYHIPYDLLMNDKISLKAKALYSVIGYLSPGHYISINFLSMELKESKDSLASGINELKKHGFLNVEKKKDGRCIYSVGKSKK